MSKLTNFLITTATITLIALAGFSNAQSQNRVKTNYYYSSSPAINVTSLNQNMLNNSLSPKTKSPIEITRSKKTIVLEKSNTIILRGVIDVQSVSKVMKEILEKDETLDANEPILLVLDTPGGSVFDGLNMIDLVHSLNRPVHTVTLFAASMGFQIVQNLDKRYITNHGVLMSHRASGGLKGQYDGELESRYQTIKRSIDYMDKVASNRLEISIKEYKDKVANEYWIKGFDSIQEKVADEIVGVKCGKSLNGTTTQIFRTFLGEVKLTVSECPLLKGVLGIENISVSDSNLKEITSLINTIYENPRRYTQDYISTNKHYNYFSI